MSTAHSTLSVGLAWLSMIAAAGCSRNDPGRFRPASDVAKAALSAALNRWMTGGNESLHLKGDIAVELIDKQRPPGQRLKSFRVVGEVSGDGGRWFEVELTLVDPDEVAHDRYVVVGINPLWVFRQADYEMLQHWDHPMPAPSPAIPAGAAEKTDDSKAQDSG